MLKNKSDKLTISYKGYKLTLGPGESSTLIRMLQKEWPLQKGKVVWLENVDIAKLRDLEDNKEYQYNVDGELMTVNEIQKTFGKSILKFKKSVSK